MIKSIYTAASGMVVQQKRQENVANNLANAQTAAFKMQDLLVSATGESPMVREQDGDRTVIGSMPSGIEIDDLLTDFSQGLIETSDRDLDFAIEGSGFFNIQYGTDRAFTRNGSLTLDRDGRLVNSQGYALIGTDLSTGENGDVVLPSEDFTIAADGTVAVSGTPRYKLQISDFIDYGDLENLGNGIYRNVPVDGLNKEVMADTFALVQGASEQSNVDILEEMVKMIEISRAFESNQRVIQSADEILDKVANQIGKL